MKKRSLLTSVAASTVLAGVLMMSGCGGTNSGDEGDNVNKVEISEGTSGQFTEATATIGVEFPVIGKDSNGVAVQTSGFRISREADLSSCIPADPCTITCVQKCPTELSQGALDAATALAPSVPDSDEKIVLYAGTIDITELNGKLTDCGMEVTVKLPMCAFANAKFSVDGVEQTHETSDGHLITALEKCDVIKIYVEGTGWVTGVLTGGDCGADKYVTFTVNGCPSEILVYALRHYVPGSTSGMTGGNTGGEGY